MIIVEVCMAKRLFSVIFSVVILSLSVTRVHAEEQSIEWLRSTFDADYYAKNNLDVAQTVGGDSEALFQHYVNNGFRELRGGSAETDIANMTFIPAFTLPSNGGNNTISIYSGVNGGLGIYTSSSNSNSIGKPLITTHDYVENPIIHENGNYEIPETDDINVLLNSFGEFLNQSERLQIYFYAGAYVKQDYEGPVDGSISVYGNMVEYVPELESIKYMHVSKNNGNYVRMWRGYESNTYNELFDYNGTQSTKYTVSIAFNTFDQNKAIFVTKINGDDGFERIDYYILLNELATISIEDLEKLCN